VAGVTHPRAVRIGSPTLDPATGSASIVVAPGGDRAEGDEVAVDGVPVGAVLEVLDDERAALVEASGSGEVRIPLLLLAAQVPSGVQGARRLEVVIEGWSIELEVESERRAALRERARRGSVDAALGGPTEVRAIIPGRVLSVSVVPGDAVVAGQQLLVVEAMKMQNELRAPRDGTIATVDVGTGRTIEVGDLLLVLT
jgi:biotin carboxyl carrier protein